MTTTTTYRGAGDEIMADELGGLRPDVCLTLEGTRRIIPVFNGRKVEEEH